ncbi:MAG: hypothetical protein KME10_18010 [Plectolyngbya sp. WJT66-NPBG17]|jgi:hypothetical protein|nr:hypothetical protein [Plectolyngbya sp. WJT66-NPBG17]
MPGGRKPRYNPETVNQICELIAETGVDRVAYEGVGIAHTTFYAWMVDKEEFSAAVTAARAKYAAKLKQKAWDRVAAANEYIDDVLKRQCYRTTRQEVLDRKGRKVVLVKEEQIIPDSKLLDRVLGLSEGEINPSFRFEIGLATPDQSDDEP